MGNEDQYNMRSVALILLCSTLCITCKERSHSPVSENAPPEAWTTVSWPAKMKTEGGGYLVEMTPTEGKIEGNKHFSLNVSVTPTASKQSEFSVIVDANMPFHGHGMNTQPELVADGENKYRVDGMLFHMDGEWEITVDVQRDEAKERATFQVLLE